MSTGNVRSPKKTLYSRLLESSLPAGGAGEARPLSLVGHPPLQTLDTEDVAARKLARFHERFRADRALRVAAAVSIPSLACHLCCIRSSAVPARKISGPIYKISCDSGPRNSFYCLGHFKNVYDDDDDDDEYYDYITIMPKLRSPYDQCLIYRTSYKERTAFPRYDSLAKL